MRVGLKIRPLPAVLVAIAISGIASAQTYTISTFAGSSPAAPLNVPATSASLSPPYGIAVDAKGNVFFTNGYYGYFVLRLDAATGIPSLVAGNGTAGFSGDDGLATSAAFNTPLGLARDSAGNLYIADLANSRIRKVTNGVITTVAGNGTLGFSGDGGPATSAQLSGPSNVAVDSAGNLYIVDTGNQRIRKVSNGIITTVAGNGAQGFSGDNGPAIDARLYNPSAVAVDSAGNLYIADSYNNRIREVSNGMITTVAGGVPPTGTIPILGPGLPPYGGFGGDGGPATAAQMYDPTGVAVDAAGNLYIADYFNGRIREVSAGVITTVAGGGTSLSDGSPTSAKLGPSGSRDPSGNLYIADVGSNRIRKLSGGVITTVAGNGQPPAVYSGDNGPATSALLSHRRHRRGHRGQPLHRRQQQRPHPQGLERSHHHRGGERDLRLQRRRRPGHQRPVERSHRQSRWIPPAISTSPTRYNNRIRKVSNGVITTVAGNGDAGLQRRRRSGHQRPVELSHGRRRGLRRQPLHRRYATTTASARSRTACITTVAGNGVLAPSNGIPGDRGYGGFSGDNGPATSAQLSTPTASRWTPPATSTFPITITIASARSRTASSPPWRETGRMEGLPASAAMAVRPPAPS